jgi:4-amino-4-deoxy-L-arabinose transferase-like glycosyltransferase
MSDVSSRSFARLLTAIACGGFALRLVALLAMRDDRVSPDGFYYTIAANLFADGHGWPNPLGFALTGEFVPAANHPPAWSFLLAGGSVFGFRSQFEHQVIAVLVGTATVVAVGLAGRRMAGARVGLIAASIAALYPNLWIYERELHAEPLVFLGAALVLWLAYAFLDRPTTAKIVGLAAGCTILALTRAEQMLLLVALFVPLVLLVRGRRGHDRIRWLVIGGVTSVLVLAPWVVYNNSRFEEPVTITTGFGEALRVGNCQSTYSGTLLGSYDQRCRKNLRPYPDPSVEDGRKRREALTFMRAHLRRLPVVIAAREGRTWGLFAPMQQSRLDSARGMSPNHATPLWLIRTGFVVYWLLLPFAVAGAFVARRRHIPLWPLVAFIMTVAVAVAITFGETRYRAGAEIPIVLLAALGIDAAVRAVRRKERGPEASEISPDEPSMVDGESYSDSTTVSSRRT